MERLGATVAPYGSFNNEIGHPLTVLRVTGETRYLVLELSARGAGHIAQLCQIAPPRLGAVLCVGHAHTGEFGGLAEVALAKGELPAALPPDGVALLNAHDPLGLAMAERTAARGVTVGVHAPASGRRAFAVLGPMNELGDESPQWHEQVGGLAAQAGVAGLIVVGEEAAPMLSGAKAEPSWHGDLIGVPDTDSAVSALGNLLAPG